MGAGLFPYLPFVAKLAATGIPCLCVKMRHVSMQLTHSIPTATEVAADVVAALDSLGVEKVMGGMGAGKWVWAGTSVIVPFMTNGLPPLIPESRFA